MPSSTIAAMSAIVAASALRDRHVEAVVDVRGALGPALPLLERRAQAARVHLQREVDDAGRAAGRRGLRAGVVVVDAPGAAERHREVRVVVDRARQHEAAGGVDRPRRRRRRTLPTPAIVSPSISTSARTVSDGGHDRAAADDLPHGDPPPRRRVRDPLDRRADRPRVGADRELEVLDRRVLLLGVADAVRRGREDHHRRHVARHLGRVVQRARRQRVIAARPRPGRRRARRGDQRRRRTGSARSARAARTRPCSPRPPAASSASAARLGQHRGERRRRRGGAGRAAASSRRRPR